MKLSRIYLFWGVTLIIIGIGFLGESVGFWEFEVFFYGWWTLFIIIPCVVNMFESGIKRSNTIGVTVGGLLLLSSWQIIKEDLVIPILLVVIGMTLLFIRPRAGGQG